MCDNVNYDTYQFYIDLKLQILGNLNLVDYDFSTTVVWT